MIVCIRIPRFELAVAAGGRKALGGRPLALAPAPGREARVGEVSGAAEAFGVVASTPLGEALSRCPALELIAPDPVRVTEAWERVALRLEGIGAAVELERPGVASFAADGLRGLHGGTDGVLRAARQAAGTAARIGVAPTRFCALAASLEARTRRPVVIAGGARAARDYLAGRPVGLLAHRPRTERLVRALTRLGILTLGELAALPRGAIADRFGPDGLLAWRLSRGADSPPIPRVASPRLHVCLELEESASGPVLERTLGLLLDRLLAHPERRGRPLRSAVLGARLVEGGTWRERVIFRTASGDPVRMRLALTGRLALLPSPAEALSLAADELGVAGAQTMPLLEDSVAVRQARLREAVAQARAAGGPQAALRVVDVDPDSRVPERRMMLTPFG